MSHTEPQRPVRTARTCSVHAKGGSLCPLCRRRNETAATDFTDDTDETDHLGKRFLVSLCLRVRYAVLRTTNRQVLRVLRETSSNGVHKAPRVNRIGALGSAADSGHGSSRCAIPRLFVERKPHIKTGCTGLTGLDNEGIACATWLRGCGGVWYPVNPECALGARILSH